LSFIIDPYRFNVCPAEALAFIAAAGITDATQKQAICTLVSDLQSYGIWNKMKAIYPFCGSTSTQQKYNLKDPRDLDAAYRLVFNGGWSFSNNGALPNGVNSYADTKLNPSGIISENNISISIYSRTNSDGVFCDLGANVSGSTTAYQYSIYARLTNLTYTFLGSQSQSFLTYSNTDSRGHFISSRTSSISFKTFLNSVLKATLTTAQTQSILSRNIFLSASNDSVFGAIQYSNRELAFAHIGDGLTDTEAVNFYTAVQAYQTTLGRQV
jgi:hypothetical protein